MKKVIFAIILMASLFAITGLALADSMPSTGTFGEIWTAINDLRNQIIILRSDLEHKIDKRSPEKPLATDGFIKITKETPAEKTDKHVSRSEHYTMSALMFQ